MRKLLTRQVMSVWIAILAVLFSALAPAISHAMSAAPAPDEAVEVCTMEGMKTIVLASTGPGKSLPGEHVFAHCPWCATHGNASLALPPASFVFVLPDASPAYPPLFYQAPAPLFSWTAAPPRGPPGVA